MDNLDLTIRAFTRLEIAFTVRLRCSINEKQREILTQIVSATSNGSRQKYKVARENFHTR
jgi:hypothetical protein